ncbi:MAG: N-acetylglucosamine-6-phosphate deacetylase [Acidobacteria bacterium RIFCSPLOWO2_12_FULL_54_10]|nr:MAG: N-acetylglucosamine-6-phosphate deacetylase [Acidobacteria bacterium RIFCSPLOWO2_12_FULL_54_10]
MPLIAVTARQVFTPLETIEDGVVLVEDGFIRDVFSRRAAEIPSSVRIIDLGERILAPGFVDLHIHGASGRDVMEGSEEALIAVAQYAAQHGTTSFLPTTLTAPIEDLQRSLHGLDSAIGSWKKQTASSNKPLATPLGIHMEGPFLSPERRGVHPSLQLLNPSIPAFSRLREAAGESLRILTLAPELDGAIELQAYAIQTGVRVALGHSNATYEQTQRSIDAGARHAVHVFNAMRPFSHRDAGIIGAVLTDDRVYTEVIVDGVHVEETALRLLLKAKGDEKILLVTDAVSATGMCPGRYMLGGIEITLGDDPRTGRPCCRNIEGKLAGSVLTQDRAVRNFSAFTGVHLREAVKMASWNPARLMGIENQKGSIQKGADADMVALMPDGRVKGIMIGGIGTFGF